MKKIIKYIFSAVLLGMFVLPVHESFAGNKDRSGEAGGPHLLINPWAQSSGWGNVSTGGVRGVDATFGNIAGTAFTQGTEVNFTNTDWLRGTGTNIMAFGLTQKVGDAGVLGLTFMNMSFGDIDVTEVDSPDFDQFDGTFSPNFMYIGLSYSKEFSNSIYGGIQVKIINEGIDNISATGIAIDAGIQYVSGDNDEIKFGITLRNWGPTMKYKGSGMAMRVIPSGQDDKFTLETRSVDYELPSQLNIGASYDILFSENRFTIAGQFAANSFTNDMITLGGEFSLREYLQLRAGYTYENGMFDGDGSIPLEGINVYDGPSAGMTVNIPINKDNGSTFAVDYSFRSTKAFDNTHSIGVRINF
ncbi:MAG: PorV/PorQ family protein [Bacteroidales bacterium]|nr:PorV/PorQ family protein [Bacteroidales bacterium]